MEPNPCEEMVRAKAATEPMAPNPIEGAARANDEPRLKTNSGGGLIMRPRRGILKKMMFKKIVQTIVSWFHPTAMPPKT
ncbi:hypothetical protein Acr_04g0002930 [Actinidia rufa]|uniref:Uncharacterized protein n=1 Tax=Actinidia rufa TaxID=165716 RepID=A0A7J0EGF6_9ERIC|nr:hypothetical protein Acr_04g0002820 [Actinidia rufa]GFY85555.1 hypothetical protein Acr_04g0002930 [Actinidia rufa]